MNITRQKLIEVAKERLDVELTEEIIEEGKMFKDLGVDSLETIELIIQLEDELDIELDDSRLEEIKNIKELDAYLAEVH